MRKETEAEAKTAIICDHIKKITELLAELVRLRRRYYTFDTRYIGDVVARCHINIAICKTEAYLMLLQGVIKRLKELKDIDKIKIWQTGQEALDSAKSVALELMDVRHLPKQKN